MMWIYCFESLRLDDFVKCEKMNPLIKKCFSKVLNGGLCTVNGVFVYEDWHRKK